MAGLPSPGDFLEGIMGFIGQILPPLPDLLQSLVSRPSSGRGARRPKSYEAATGDPAAAMMPLPSKPRGKKISSPGLDALLGPSGCAGGT